MAFITGVFLIDAPASALNNSGEPIPGVRAENSASTKFIRTRQGDYPYVSAQAFRFWLRGTLDRMAQTQGLRWQSAPVSREAKVAYTDGNPIEWWDDDLLGYMRAPSKKKRGEAEDDGLTPLEDEKGNASAITRVSPFRVSTLVAMEPVYVTNDFGVMARHEGDPVPFEHQFYRATLKGLFSLDLHAAGTFSFRDRTGFRNLDSIRRRIAEERGLEKVGKDAYRLPFEQRVERVQALLDAMARLEGGAKQALHYTDVSPAFVMAAVTRGGNHPFGRVVSSERGMPVIHQGALDQAYGALQEDILSNVHVGRAQGFMDSADEVLAQYNLTTVHPREALESLAGEIFDHPDWWD